MGDVRLVPLDYPLGLPVFMRTIMAALLTLGRDEAVQQFVGGGERGAMIFEMSRGVIPAGERALGSGLLKDRYDESLRPYTPEEVWAFDLLIDVIAMLASLQGLETRSAVTDKVKSLTDTAHRHEWTTCVRRAGAGPENLRDLRGQVPHASRHGRD
jgi:hypothetical protein